MGPVVVLAPDKFKGTLTAVQAAAGIGAAIRRVRPDADVRMLPIADGGEGTVDAAVAAGFARIPARVTGPIGRPVDAAPAVRGRTAVVELAQSSGLALLPAGPAPLTADTTGVGELIARALELGCTRIVLGLGGAASTDGGSGPARALGARLLDAAGAELPPGGAALLRLDRIERDDPAARLTGVEVVIASDVDNPLLGPKGAAAVYGPQKGATPQDVRVLHAALARWAEVVGPEWADVPGAGAAGGAGYGALAFLDASVRPGIGLLLELLGFDELLDGAELVVTGEGSLDRQTLHGKAPAGVAAAARERGVPVAVVCGRVELSRAQLDAAGIVAAYALADLGADSMTRAGELVEDAGELLARDLPADRAEQAHRADPEDAS
ncbi:glycerate kinase [Embleya scabrispora]|uniref:glycerate kinase n=1 Tax=Embleya scabrispora TaxID=159449 RepID=UPI000382724F|nr:glycerate kinase [Embleya scabrispora]MYS82895.1 glycerate kinase [Streptomyces sp. SID5474]